jgi:hypothetical protein
VCGARPSRVSWLTLRRTYSSWAHEKGVAGKVIAQLMGHTKVDTTLNVYTQVIDGSARTAADKVGSELFTIVHNLEKASELTHRKDGSSGWTRTSNPPVNGLMRVVYLVILRVFSSTSMLLVPGVWEQIVHELFTPTFSPAFETMRAPS